MNRKEELEFGRQMDASLDKKAVADLVIKYNKKNVLDLGAGTGIISKLISEAGICCTAVDNNFKIESPKNTSKLFYVPYDIITFVSSKVTLFKKLDNDLEADKQKVNTLKYDCIILSAVLHELNKKEFNYLKKNLHKIVTDDCIVIIREPYYQRGHSDKRVWLPFTSLEEQNMTMEEIINVTDPGFQKLFNSIKKTSSRRVPYPIKVLNMAFTYSYGKDSWEREVKEYRYTFSYKALVKFIKRIYTNNVDIIIKTNFDSHYVKHFKACGYSDNILNSIDYTNCTLIAGRECDLSI